MDYLKSYEALDAIYKRADKLNLTKEEKSALDDGKCAIAGLMGYYPGEKRKDKK